MAGDAEGEEAVAVEGGEGVLVVCVEEPTAFQLDLVVAADTALGLDEGGDRSVVAVDDGAGQYLGVLEVVERQPRADEDVVVEGGRGCRVVAAVDPMGAGLPEEKEIHGPFGRVEKALG